MHTDFVLMSPGFALIPAFDPLKNAIFGGRKGGMCATCYAWCNHDRDSSKGELTDVWGIHCLCLVLLLPARLSWEFRNSAFWISSAASVVELKAIVWGGYLPEAGMMGKLCICVSVLKIMMIAMSTRESACQLCLSGSFIFNRFWLSEVVCACNYVHTCIYVLVWLEKCQKITNT